MARDDHPPYQECMDEDCERFPCKVYKEGWSDGFDEGYGAGSAAGYEAGFDAGYSQATADAG